MRADAQRNRDRLLDAAVELILGVGGEPSREAIAERAGVGIGTLYRHFPDQQSLLHAVVRRTLERTIDAGESFLVEAPDGLEALRQYIHGAIDSGIAVVNVVFPLVDKRRWPDLRARATLMLKTLIKRGIEDGSVRSDTTPADIVFATTRFSRPLAVGLSASEERAIAHRQVDIYVDGLRALAKPGSEARSRGSKGPKR